MIAVIHKYERSFNDFKEFNSHLNLKSIKRVEDLRGYVFKNFIILDYESSIDIVLVEIVKTRIR